MTAFLIQLYLELQPDSNQTTNNLLNQTTSLLGQISQQLANSSIVPVEIPTPSPPFQASGSTIWISTLWFLSLILSLAAALFGMISKQWLREYLQWTTMSGPSENLVALRQARYEAFMDWKTPAVIALMPVLLEIALIVFLLGLEGLLWTLNIIVFSVCTVAVVTLIMMVIVVTVLPVFRARCPYKSPVGWACVLVKPAIFSLWNRLLDLVQAVGDILTDNSFLASDHHLPVVIEKDWRGWDLTRQTWTISGELWSETGSAAAIHRHWMLTRALYWIRENSEDQRLVDATGEGFASRVASPLLNPFKVLVADVYFACEYLGINPTGIVPSWDQCADFLAGDTVIKRPTWNTARFDITLSRLTPGGGWEDFRLRSEAPPPVLSAVAELLASDLLAVLVHYNDNDVQYFGKRADYFLQLAYYLIYHSAHYVMFSEVRPPVPTDTIFELADHLFRNHATNSPHFMPILQDFLEGSLGSSTLVADPYTLLALNAPRGQLDSWSSDD